MRIDRGCGSDICRRNAVYLKTTQQGTTALRAVCQDADGAHSAPAPALGRAAFESPAFDLAVQIFRGVEAPAGLTLAFALDALRLVLHSGEPLLSDNRAQSNRRECSRWSNTKRALSAC